MLNVDHKGLHIENLNELNKEHSPSIPRSFPKERLPKDMCQHSLSKMLHCLMASQANKCGEFNKTYFMCKRERDAQIFESIRSWEIEHIKNVKNPQDYIQNLQDKRQKLIKEFENTPASLANKHKRWRMAADIEQLKWRSDYLEKQE